MLWYERGESREDIGREVRLARGFVLERAQLKAEEAHSSLAASRSSSLLVSLSLLTHFGRQQQPCLGSQSG